MTCTLTVEIEVERRYESTENVDVQGRETKEATLSREIESVEKCLEIIDGTTNKVVRMCWNEVKDTEEFENFGWYGPYARGDITLSPSNYDTLGPTVHDIVDKIAEIEEIENKAGIYMDLIENSPRINVPYRRFLEFLADEHEIDTSYYVHGERVE